MNKIILRKVPGAEYLLRNTALKVLFKTTNPQEAASMLKHIAESSGLTEAEENELLAWFMTFTTLMWITATLDN